MVEIKFIGFIAEKMGAQGMKVSLKQPVRLKDIVEVDLSKDRSIVLINHKRGTLDSLIKNGDKVMIMPVVSGGWRQRVEGTQKEIFPLILEVFL